VAQNKMHATPSFLRADKTVNWMIP